MQRNPVYLGCRACLSRVVCICFRLFLVAPLWCSFQNLCILHHHFCYASTLWACSFTKRKEKVVFFLLKSRVKQANVLDLFHCRLVIMPRMQSSGRGSESALSSLRPHLRLHASAKVQSPESWGCLLSPRKLQGQLGFSSLFFSCIWVFPFFFLWIQLFF